MGNELLNDPLNRTEVDVEDLKVDLTAKPTDKLTVDPKEVKKPESSHEEKKEVKIDTDKDTFTKAELTAIVARAAHEARKEGRAAAQAAAPVDNTIAERLAAIEAENKKLKLDKLAAEFNVDVELFEDSPKTGADLRAFVEKLSKLGAKSDEDAPAGKSYSQVRKVAEKSKVSNLSPQAQQIAAIVRKQRGQ